MKFPLSYGAGILRVLPSTKTFPPSFSTVPISLWILSRDCLVVIGPKSTPASKPFPVFNNLIFSAISSSHL